MNDKQIVEYCRNLIKANLTQYTDDNPAVILSTLYKLENDKSNKELLEHCYGVKELLEKCIEILERKQKNKDKQ